MKIEWDESLSTGIQEIDAQHRSLFAMLNGLISAMEAKRGRDEMMKVIKFLDDYVVMHFGTEEAYMKRYGFPGYDRHHAEHRTFIDSYTGLKLMYEESGITSALLILTQSKICNWILNHVGKLDREFGAYLKPRLGKSEKR
jgi:hemerythrin